MTVYQVLCKSWHGLYANCKGSGVIIDMTTDFAKACQRAHEHGDSEIVAIEGAEYQRIVYVQDGSKWYFYDGSPYMPTKFQEGQAVKAGDKAGNIEYHFVVSSDRDNNPIPPFQVLKITYVVNNHHYDEDELQPLQLSSGL